MKFLTTAGSGVALLAWGGGSITGITYTVDPSLFGGLPPLGPAELTFSEPTSAYYFKGGVCVKAMLDDEEKGILKDAKTNILHQTRETQDKHWENLPNKFLNPSGEAKGCAAVAWEEETWKGGLWKGQLKYEWLYKKGNETLITYAAYNPAHQDQNGTYETSVTWRTVYLDKTRKQGAGFLMVLARSTYFLESPTGSPHWGFNLNRASKKVNTCRDTIKCIDGEGTRTSKEFKWTWERHDGGEQRFADWSKNFKSAMASLMGDSLISLNSFKDLMLEKGTWTER